MSDGTRIQGIKKLTSAAKVCAVSLKFCGWQIDSADGRKSILLQQYKLFGVKVKKTAKEDGKIAKIAVNLYPVYKKSKKCDVVREEK